jgi:hypothetical protein
MRLFCFGNPQKPRFRRERPHPRPAVPFINELRTQEISLMTWKFLDQCARVVGPGPAPLDRGFCALPKAKTLISWPIARRRARRE